MTDMPEEEKKSSITFGTAGKGVALKMYIPDNASDEEYTKIFQKFEKWIIYWKGRGYL